MSDFYITSEEGVKVFVRTATPASYVVQQARSAKFRVDGALRGPKGDTGATGAQGPQGIQGPAGADGSDGKLTPNDLTVVSGRGIARQWQLVAGLPIDHGEVADEAAMLALHVDSAETAYPRWVVPGDYCTRADLGTGYLCLCTAGNGTTAADWVILPRKAALDALATASQPLNVDLTAIAAQGLSTWGLAWLALSGATAAKNALSVGRADIGDATAIGRALMGIATPSSPKIPQLNTDGSVTPVDMPSGVGTSEWESVETITLTAGVAGVTLPSSGAFAAGYVYRIQFDAWTAAGSGEERDMRIDVGSGIITSASYERHTVIETAGSSAQVYSYGENVTSIVSLAATAAASAVAGEVIFTPSDQNGSRTVFVSTARYANASGRATLSRSTGALSSPTTSAIQRVYLFAYGLDSTGGKFRLSRRAL